MADLSITPSAVALQSGSTFDGTAGATITAGQVVYYDTATSKLKLADSNVAGASGADLAVIRGIALHASLDGQPLRIQTDGVIAIGATVVLGESYVLSDTPGGIHPVSDIDTGATQYVSWLGIGTTVAQITLKFFNSGIKRA
jgi:hypothetical protein